jgi:hypothetical protein
MNLVPNHVIGLLSLKLQLAVNNYYSQVKNCEFDYFTEHIFL